MTWYQILTVAVIGALVFYIWSKVSNLEDRVEKLEEDAKL